MPQTIDEKPIAGEEDGQIWASDDGKKRELSFFQPVFPQGELIRGI
jgi:hypothetical protein